MSKNKNLKWNKENIEELLKTNDRAVMRALVVLYSFQTQDEKEAGLTLHPNKRGFNAYDARALSKAIEKVKTDEGFTKEELDCIRPKILKYSAQLATVANEREAERKQEEIEEGEQIVFDFYKEMQDEGGRDEDKSTGSF